MYGAPVFFLRVLAGKFKFSKNRRMRILSARIFLSLLKNVLVVNKHE